MKQTNVNRFAAHVSLHRFQDVHAGVLLVGCGLKIDPGVERIHLNGVVMERTGSWSTRATIGSAGGADLPAAVGQWRSHGYAFRHSGRARRNIPDEPVH